jgi:DnaJ-class molecular chaperone
MDSLIKRERQLNERKAALQRRQDIEPELSRLFSERKLTYSEKLIFSDVFAAIPSNLEVCFTDADGDTFSQSGSEFLAEFLEDLSEGVEIDSVHYPLLKQIIDETYTDKIDKINKAWLYPSGQIEVSATDEGRQLSIEIGEHVSISQTGEDSNFSASFAGTKQRNCKTGISCGATCISKTKTCKKKASGGQAAKTKEVLALVHVPRKVEAKAKGKRKPTEKAGTKSTSSDKLKQKALDRTASAIMSRSQQKEADAIKSLGEVGDPARMSVKDLMTTLLDIDGESRMELLGVTGKHYRSAEVAKSWHREMVKKIHPDVNKHSDAPYAFKELDAIYKNMTGNY